MRKKFSRFFVALAMAGAVCSTAQAAMLVRMSGKGTDAAGCGTTAAPCRTLQAAHDQVDAGGYIVAIDPADFGGVVVNKSVNISNESSGAALINAPIGADINVPGGVVRLRGMTVQGAAGAIQIRNAAQLDVVDCVIQKSAYGILGYNGAGGSYPEPRIFVANTRFSDTIAVWSASRAMFVENARIKGLVNIFNANPRPLVFANSLVEGELNWGANTAGVKATGTVGAMRNSVIRNLPIGLEAADSLFLLSRSTITGNTLAFRRSSDQPMIQSAGDNIIRGNTDDALGAVAPLALH